MIRSACLLLTAAFAATMSIDWPAPPLPAHAAWADLVMAIAALLFALTLVRREVPFSTDKRALVAATGYVAWAALSALHAGTGAWKLLGLAELATLFVVASTLARDPVARDHILRAWIVGAAFLALVGLAGSALTVAGVPSLLTSHGGALGLPWRPKGLCAEVDMLASVCLVPLVLLASTEGARLVGARVRPLLIALLSLTLVLSLSRTLLAAVLGLVMLHPQARRRAAPLAIFLVLLLGLAARFDPPMVGHGVGISTAPGLRWRIAGAALQTIAAEPLLGVGPTGHAARLGGWPDPTSPARPWDAHVTPLNVAALVGLPGLALFVLFLWFVLAPSLRRRRGDAATSPHSAGDRLHAVLEIALLAMLFDALSLDAEDLRHLWLLAALVAAGALTPAAGR